jgi:photosystem II stability/assembly factor-like uncharacterized protein
MTNEQDFTEQPHSNHASEATIHPNSLLGLEWRSIGPYRGGRVVAVAADPLDDQVFYFGSTGGGVWKTTNGGLIWENVSDGFFARASVGALAVSMSDPNVLYAGMGEATIRGNVSHGDGVYKSTDKGKTWAHLGLEQTRNIAKVRVHPHNPDIVYVAALGHAHGPNPERGIYRSKDGGKTWEHILFRGEKAGAIDLTMDPHNPRILYATFWEAARLPHTLISGGEGSAILKSSDGGDTWTDISRHAGLPAGMLGKVGIAVSPAQEGRVWALVEAQDGALFRSDDGGETWQRLSEEHGLRARAWYYMHIIADPQNANTLWILNVQAWKSLDGGHTFFTVPTPHADNHDLWIDPRNPLRMIEGNDGGACISFDGSASWSIAYNQPTVEFYHVTTDTQVPYRIYGSQQDNTSISLPNRSSLAGITQIDWHTIGGGESGYIAVRPDDPNIVFAGNYQGYITRYDHRSRQSRDISVWPELASGWGAKDQKYRFQWTAPILLSPHDPNTLYITGNLVFRSSDEGASWQAISPDLTRNDESKLGASGGPISGDNTGAEYYCTIFAFAESPLQPGLFWAGSDDGLIHISRDHGESWQNITPESLPEWALISVIEASPHDPATAYVAATCYKTDDFRPYLLKTNDYGRTWTQITTGLRADDFTRVIREDALRRGLLFAGTETAIYVSFDDGAHWQLLRLNLPVVAIHDIVVKDDDLIVATHGRAFWVLDDITPLRRITADVQSEYAHLFPPRPVIRYMTVGGFSQIPDTGSFYRQTGVATITARRVKKANGETATINLNAGQNPPDGVIVYYYLKEKPAETIKLTFLDVLGKEIKTLTSEEKQEQLPVSEKVLGSQEKEKQERFVPKEAGLNRFVWDMRYPDATNVDGFVGGEGVLFGPVVAPGTYQVQLTVGQQTYTQQFEVCKDPRVTATQEDLDAQCALRLRIRDKLSQTHNAITMLRDLRTQVENWQRYMQDHPQHEAVSLASQTLIKGLTAIEEELIQVKAKTRQDTLNHPAKLNAKLAALVSVVSSADAAPTSQTYALFDDLSARIDAQLQALQTLIDTDVASFNALMRASDVAVLVAHAFTR